MNLINSAVFKLNCSLKPRQTGGEAQVSEREYLDADGVNSQILSPANSTGISYS